jgi:dCTP deaminase
VTFLSSESLIAAGPALIDPFDPGHVVNCSIELTLGPEAYVTGATKNHKSRLSPTSPDIVIPPGQFALLLSKETVSIPADALGFISVKSSFKLRGLVSVSGFHVDPGFKGRLIFSVYNAGGTDVVVSQGQRTFLLWISRLDRETENVYDGDRQGQAEIPNNDVMNIGRSHFSPAAVNDRLTAVESQVRTAWQIAIAAVVAVVILIAGVAVDRITPKSAGDTPTPVVSTQSPSASQSTSSSAAKP